MSTADTFTDGRFYRNADKALLGGVCAGIADHLGFNLRVTRVLAFIAFLMAMPIAVVAYFAVVFLVPSASSQQGVKRWRLCGRKARRERQEHAAERDSLRRNRSGDAVAVEIDKRCHDMDARLARLEQHVTSQRFQLEQEFRNL